MLANKFISGDLNYVQQRPGFEIQVTIPENLVPVASQYPYLKIDTTRGLMSGDARVVAITVGLDGVIRQLRLSGRVI